MTSPSPEEARAGVVEAIAVQLCADYTEDELAAQVAAGNPDRALWFAWAERALDAALAARTEPETCETCGGMPWPDDEDLREWLAGRDDGTVRIVHPCPDCHGSGSRSLYLLDVIRDD